MKTTEEKNRMIAKFMGFKDLGNLVGGSPRVEKHVKGITYQSYPYSELKYHTSWDWLMPVVEEIDHLEYESERLDAIDNAIKTRVIGDVHYAVCKFIEWYNENK